MTAPGPFPPLDPRKFHDPLWTADGQKRATVALRALDTLWFNTGTLCNLTCRTCYIESSPRNDRLAYLSLSEVRTYLDEIATLTLPTTQIGFTGGEPFLNRDLIAMLDLVLERGFEALVLTNAMKPMMLAGEALRALLRRYGEKLVLRVSLDHYAATFHDAERGAGSWQMTLAGLRWLADHGFCTAIAGRRFSGESEPDLRRGYARLLAREGIPIDCDDPTKLVVFPEMDAALDVPEITEACWGILGVAPEAVMCATSRMVVKRKGAAAPAVLACTLLAYDHAFELGHSLAEASGAVALNHPHCARFCVLGGASCSPK